MRDNASVQRFWRFLGLLLGYWIVPAAELLAQNDTSIQLNIKTLPAKDKAKPGDRVIEVVIDNPTSRLMTVDVVYLPVEADDLEFDPDENPWKTKQLTINGETRRDDTGIKTKNLIIFYVAQDEKGLYTGVADADTPTVRMQGRVVHTREVHLGAKKGFMLPTHPTITMEQIKKDRARARLDVLTAQQPVLSKLVGVIVERLPTAGRSTYVIRNVAPNSPAEKYDLNNEDVIFAIDKRRFSANDDLEASMERMERTQRPFYLTIETRNGPGDYQFNPPSDRPVKPGAGEPPDAAEHPDAEPRRRIKSTPTLGVTVKTIPDARGLDFGAEIVSIAAGSMAERKRLRIGDVITSFKSERVFNEQALAHLEKELKPGMRVDLQYFSRRNNRYLNDSIEFPEFIETRMTRGGLGVLVRTNSGGGVVVEQVDPGSALEGVLQTNYIVLELNDQRTASKSAFDQAAQSLKRGQQEISLLYVNTAKRPAERVLMRFNVP